MTKPDYNDLHREAGARLHVEFIKATRALLGHGWTVDDLAEAVVDIDRDLDEEREALAAEWEAQA